MAIEQLLRTLSAAERQFRIALTTVIIPSVAGGSHKPLLVQQELLSIEAKARFLVVEAPITDDYLTHERHSVEFGPCRSRS